MLKRASCKVLQSLSIRPFADSEISCDVVGTSYGQMV